MTTVFLLFFFFYFQSPSGLLVSFLYFRTTAKVDVNKLTKTTGYLSNFIEFVGLLIYRFCRFVCSKYHVVVHRNARCYGLRAVLIKQFSTKTIFSTAHRLTAPYFFILGVVQLTMTWFHYNSVFDPPTDEHVNCPKYWWRNLLYINTLFPVQDMVSAG